MPRNDPTGPSSSRNSQQVRHPVQSRIDGTVPSYSHNAHQSRSSVQPRSSNHPPSQQIKHIPKQQEVNIDVEFAKLNVRDVPISAQVPRHQHPHRGQESNGSVRSYAQTCREGQYLPRTTEVAPVRNEPYSRDSPDRNAPVNGRLGCEHCGAPCPAPEMLKKAPGTSYGKDAFFVGMLIRTSIHEPDHHGDSAVEIENAHVRETGTRGASDVSARSKFISFSTYGPVHTKLRPFIVIALFDKHFTAVPMCTYERLGLSRKNPAFIAEHVAIRDHRDPNPPPRNYCAHTPLRTNEMAKDEKLIEQQSSVHFTSVTSMSYNISVFKSGCLSHDSKTRLLELMGNHSKKSFPAGFK